MTGRLLDETVLVAEPHQGIGQALATRFVVEGATVCCADRDAVRLLEAVSAIAATQGVFALVMDITDENALVVA